MSFKLHAMGDIKDRSPAQQMEADFHQLLREALIAAGNKGTKKREGYVMGAFRQALAKYSLTVDAKSGHDLHTLVATFNRGVLCPRCGSSFAGDNEWDKAGQTCPVCTSQHDYE